MVKTRRHHIKHRGTKKHRRHTRRHRGGFMGVLKEALVPFGLVALNNSYRKKSSKKSKRSRRSRRR